MAFTNLDVLSDDELVRLANERGGRDDRPFRLLMQRHQLMVHRVCYGFLKNAADAEERII